MEEIARRYYRSTGIPVLDGIMLGWPRRGLALVYGSQKAGKTTLTLQSAIETVRAEDKFVLYLDTESGGAGELRLHSLAEARGIPSAEIPRMLSRIVIHQAGELSEQHRIITDDWDAFRKTRHVGMYIVDSIAWHYHQRVMNAPSEHVGSVARELMGKLELQTKTLMNYARDSGASVIFTSWSASKAKKSFEDHQRRELQKAARRGIVDTRDLDVVLGTYGEDYIGGRFVGYMAKVITRIWRLQGDLRFFVVEAHRERPDQVGIYMRISEKGLTPVPDAKPVRVEAEMARRLVAEEVEAVADEPIDVEGSVGSGGAGQAPRRRMGRGKD